MNRIPHNLLVIEEQRPLARLTALRIGGPARYFCEVATPKALRAAQAWAQERDLPLLLLGSGTNVLVQDGGFAGLVVRYTDRAWQIQPTGTDHALLTIGAGAPMAGTARRVSAQGWDGLTWAEGLPGSLGGAVYGNAGCYGGDMAGVLVRGWLLAAGTVQEWDNTRLGFGYRTSALKQAAATGAPAPTVLAAELRLTRADPATLTAQMAAIAASRKSKTPWGRSCGSVFQNPPPQPDGTIVSAGQLIDQAGLKGTRVGGAEISTQHANYMLNRGAARSVDVLRLIELAREAVLREFGITLELEVRVVGLATTPDTPTERSA